MKRALVIHPEMDYQAGGEFLSLSVCKVMQELDVEVMLACENFDPSGMERVYGMGKIMENCTHLRIPEFRPSWPRFLSMQRLAYSMKTWPLFRDTDAEIVFSTQSSPFFIDKAKLVHFIYGLADLFAYPPDANPYAMVLPNNSARRPYYFLRAKSSEFLWKRGFTLPSWFFAAGTRVLHRLKQRGLKNSSLLFPPCRTPFKPRGHKKRQVIQVARIIPDKRLELFIEIAQRLSEYTFYLVGRRFPMIERLNPGYSQGILDRLPTNVVYVESPIRERPELLEESMVYLYTGGEPGIVLTVAEAIGAGCIPFSPRDTGAADVIETAKVGYLYSDVDEAAGKMRAVLEQNFSTSEIHGISKKAELFAPQAFEERIKSLATQMLT